MPEEIIKINNILHLVSKGNFNYNLKKIKIHG